MLAHVAEMVGEGMVFAAKVNVTVCIDMTAAFPRTVMLWASRAAFVASRDFVVIECRTKICFVHAIVSGKLVKPFHFVNVQASQFDRINVKSRIPTLSFRHLILACLGWQGNIVQ